MSVSQNDVVDFIKNLKLSEVKSLIETLEEELGVEASAPVMMGAVAGAAGGGEAAEEQTEFDVVMEEFGGGRNVDAEWPHISYRDAALWYGTDKPFVCYKKLYTSVAS